jgi:hypothetical protein
MNDVENERAEILLSSFGNEFRNWISGFCFSAASLASSAVSVKFG